MDVAKYIKQLGSETIIYGISGTIGRFIGIFLIPLYTRVFSPADYGVIALVASLVELVSTFIVLGLDNSSGRWFYDSDDTGQRKRIISSWFWCQALMGVIAALIISLFAHQIAGSLLDSSQYATVIRVAALMIPLGTFSKVFGNWLRYQRRAWMTMIYFTTSSLGTIGLIALFVLVWGQGLVGLYWAQVTAAVLMALVVVAVFKSWIAPQYVSWTLLKEMLVFGLPLVPASIASWVRASSDRFILQMFSETSEVGLYAIAGTIASGVALITGAFQMAWGPFAFSILHEIDSVRVYSKVLSVYSLLGCLLGTAVSLFAPLFLQLLTTPDYFPAVSCVPYLAFSYLVVGAIYIVAIGSSIAKKSTPIAVSIFTGAGVNALLNFVLIPCFGREGAAFSALLSNICAVAYLYSASQKNYHIPYQLKDALICFGFSWLLIGIDHFFIPTSGLAAFGARVSMCLLFVPLAFWLRIIKPDQVGLLFAYAGCRVRKVIDYEFR